MVATTFERQPIRLQTKIDPVKMIQERKQFHGLLEIALSSSIAKVKEGKLTLEEAKRGVVVVEHSTDDPVYMDLLYEIVTQLKPEGNFDRYLNEILEGEQGEILGAFQYLRLLDTQTEEIHSAEEVEKWGFMLQREFKGPIQPTEEAEPIDIRQMRLVFKNLIPPSLSVPSRSPDGRHRQEIPTKV